MDLGSYHLLNCHHVERPTVLVCWDLADFIMEKSPVLGKSSILSKLGQLLSLQVADT